LLVHPFYFILSGYS
jgi:thiaminase